MGEGEETIVDKAQEESGEEETTEETEETTSQDTQDQDESSNDKLDQLKEKAPDHLLKDDGSINQEEVLKQNLGFRKKQSKGELEEAIEFYDEHKEDIEELKELEEVDEDLSDLEENEEEEVEESEEDEEEVDEDETDIPDDPSEYELTIYDDEDKDSQTSQDEMVIENAKEAAYEAGMTQDQFEQFVQKWEDGFQDKVEGNIDPEEELKKLSDDKQEAKKMVNRVANYIEQKHEDGYLNDREYQEALFMAETAEGVSVLQKLMNKNQEVTDIPTDTESVGQESIQDKKQKLQELRKHDAYKDQHHPEHDKIVNKINKLTQEVVDAREG